MKVYLVMGYDVGGNTGNTVEAIFSTQRAADIYANTPERYRLNRAFNKPTPFEVDEWEVDDPANASTGDAGLLD